MQKLFFFKKTVTPAILLLTVIFVFGCGGGGGPAPTTDPDVAFPLYEPDWDVPGYEASFSGTGTITEGDNSSNITVNYSTQTLAEEFLGTVESGFGTLVINRQVLPVQVLLNINNTQTNETISVLRTIYYDAQNKTPILLQTNAGTTYIVTELPNLRPATGQLDDFGELPTWLVDNGDKQIGTWILKSSNSGYILLQQDYTTMDSSEDVIAIETDKFKINEEGIIVEVYAILHDYDKDVIIEFTGSRD